MEDKSNEKILLPLENIIKIIKTAFQDGTNCKLTKETKELFQEILTEFIGIVSSEAIEKMTEENRKIISGDDIINSLASLGFDKYVEILKTYQLKLNMSYNQKNEDENLIEDENH